ncbi:transporter family protein [Klebsormidium nitens]|uniref:Transporter family protein n=1 Tax=Klebsormidium nitens TaxID=105231 RepID=A0A1Y1IFI0_KLENI|nr:transporter family protein [Klebsormidium nitens]|eukprot:GAQ86868.1 transporter family protein [Klebsormidium nitens]
MAPPASYLEIETTRTAAMVDGRLEIAEEDEAEQGIAQPTDEDSAGVYTVEDAIEASGFGPFHTMLLLYTGTAWLADACEMILLSYVGPAARCEWHLSPAQEGAISSAVFLGVFLGSNCWGIVSDEWGRRVGFFATAVFTLVFGLLSAVSPAYWFLLVSRALVGFGLGGGSVIFSLFMEFIPSSRRGFWLVCVEFFWTIGSVAQALLAWIVMPTLQWRWLVAFSATPFLLLLIFYPVLPESPRYLMVKGREKSSLAVLQRMAVRNRKSLPPGRLVHSHPKDRPSPEHPTEVPGTVPQSVFERNLSPQKRRVSGYQKIPAPGGHEDEKRTTQKRPLADAAALLRDLLSPSLWRSTVILWLVFFACAFTYYGLVLLTTQIGSKRPGLSGTTGEDCGQDSKQVQCSAEGLPIMDNSAYRDVLITSCAEFPGTLIAALMIDVVGRKRSLFGMLLFSSACLLPLLHTLSESLTTLLLFGARAAIQGSFSVIWAYGPELYPTAVRSTGLGVGNGFARLGGFVCPFVAVDLIASCQRGLAVGLFCAVPLIAAIATLCFPKETKASRFEEKDLDELEAPQQ